MSKVNKSKVNKVAKRITVWLFALYAAAMVASKFSE